MAATTETFITIEQLAAILSVDQAEATVVGDRFVVIQRDPQPDEENIKINTDIHFLIVDLDADPLDALPSPSFTVSIEGAVVGSYDGVTFSPVFPWDGDVDATTSDDPYVGWKVVLEQPSPSPFSSEQVVDVDLDMTLSDGYGHVPYGHYPYGHPEGGATLNFSWSFTIEDLTPPSIIDADAIDLFTVRITFDDEMATSGDGSVLDLDKWADTITRLNEDPLPGVTLEVVGITEVDGSGGTQFDLVFNWEQTQGCLYQIDVDPTVEDSSGNAMDPDGSTAQFTGFQIPPVEGRRFDHWTMMVPLKNREEDATRDLERFSNCFAELLGLLLNDVDRFTDQFDPDTATDDQIEAMLYDLGNPFDPDEYDLDENDRRKLLRVLVDIYKLKGTAPGIEDTIWFLLGEVVHVIPAASEGWILGEDELGEGGLAEVLCDSGETYDLSTEKQLTLEVDGYAGEQTIYFVPSNFVVPSAALASEVVDVINAQMQEGGAYVNAAGTPASYVIGGGTYSLTGGEDVQMEINGAAASVIFHAEDFETPGVVTASEVAARIQTDLADEILVSVAEVTEDITLTTIHTGADAEIKFNSGSALTPLGIAPGDTASGTDAKRISCYSNTAGAGAWIQITGGTANDVLNFDSDVYGGTGGAILAPEDSYTLYSFDIETEAEVDAETEQHIRWIAEYMKPAHEHLVNIRTALPPPLPDGWLVGIKELDVTTVLTQ